MPQRRLARPGWSSGSDRESLRVGRRVHPRGVRGFRRQVEDVTRVTDFARPNRLVLSLAGDHLSDTTSTSRLWRGKMGSCVCAPVGVGALEPGSSCIRRSLSPSSFDRIWCTPALFRTPSSLAHAVSRRIAWFRLLLNFARETPVPISSRGTATLVVSIVYLTPCHLSLFTANSTELRTVL